MSGEYIDLPNPILYEALKDTYKICNVESVALDYPSFEGHVDESKYFLFTIPGNAGPSSR